MSRIKVSRTQSKSTPTKSKEWPAVVYVWALSLALVSYLVARVTLDAYPHPYHWGGAIAGGLFGIGVGWLWYRWRGDIF